jgi:hypothetical protein
MKDGGEENAERVGGWNEEGFLFSAFQFFSI